MNERQFWSSYHFSQKAKDYFIPYESITNMEKGMKEIFLPFSDLEIHFHDVAKAKFVEEMRKHFGIFPSLILLMIYTFMYYFTG